MSLAFNGERLREARRFRQLSITQLAKQINVTKQMISKYEHNDAQPTIHNFQHIVSVLQFPLSYFQQNDNFSYNELGVFYRSRLSSTQSEKTPSAFLRKYLAIIANFLEDYVNFPELRELEFSVNPVVAAKQLREYWKLGNEPINNMVSLLESKGFLLANISSFSNKVDAFSIQNEVNGKKYYCILISQDNNSFYRQQFSLAHELGHWVLHSKNIDPLELDSQEYRDIEQEANDFASNFLLPEISFTEDIKKQDQNIDFYINLKKKWHVSAASMIFRSRNLNLISSKDYIRFQKRISARGWRKNEPFDEFHSIPQPQLMKQAFNLLFNANIISDQSLSSLLENNRNISLPSDIIAQLMGITEEQVNRSNKDKIVTIK